MLLRIPEPTRFYCEADEDHFFAWLNGIAAVKSVVGAPDGIELTIPIPIDQFSFYELVGLLTRYQLDAKTLRPLCQGHSDPWFMDKKNYWYEAVHGG
jgi:hypothetical protein